MDQHKLRISLLISCMPLLLIVLEMESYYDIVLGLCNQILEGSYP